MKSLFDKTNYNFIDKLPNSSGPIIDFLKDHINRLQVSIYHVRFIDIIIETEGLIKKIIHSSNKPNSKVDKELLNEINNQLNSNLIHIKFHTKQNSIDDKEYFNFINHSKQIAKIKHKFVAEPFKDLKALDIAYASNSIIRIMNRGNKPVIAGFYANEKLVGNEIIAMPYKLIEKKHGEISTEIDELRIRNSNTNFILCLIEEIIEIT